MTLGWRGSVPAGAGYRRAFGAGVALVALAFGVPLLLAGLAAQLPLDPTVLSPRAWTHVDDGGLLLFVLMGLAWVAWAVMVLSIALEAWSAVRVTATPRIPGLAAPQRLAAGLVAALFVTLTPPSGPVVPSPAAHGTDAAVLVTQSQRVAAATAPDSAGERPSVAVAASPVGRMTSEDLERSTAGGSHAAVTEAASDPHDVGPTITTKRHDTLWLLAEQHLGSGQRYAEIVELNVGVVQPDGRALTIDGRIYPGWTLILPADARVDAPRPDRHVVNPGDTLWAIAQQELGDPSRYPQIAELNMGDLQADGSALADPDLIRPGWVLELPGDGLAQPGKRSEEHQLASTPAATGTTPAAGSATGDTGQDEPLILDRSPDHATSLSGEPQPSASSNGVDRAAPARGAGRAAGSTGVEGVPALDRAAPSAADSGEPAAPAPLDPSTTPSTSRPEIVQHAGEPAQPDHDAVVVTSQDRDLLGGGGAAVLAGGGVVTSLLLAGLGMELIRRRRQYQRFRQPGELMPTPGPDAREVERAARGALRGSVPQLLGVALTQVATESERSGLPLPEVRLARVTSDSLELELESPSTHVLPPFKAEDPRRWVLDRQQVNVSAGEAPRALPGLVTLGTTGSQTLLVNLDVVGTLSLSGPEGVVADVVRGLAIELAFGTASEMTERTLCVADPSVAGVLDAGSMAVESDAAAVAAMITAVCRAGTDSSGQAAGNAPNPPVSAGGPWESDPLHLVLADQPLGLTVEPRSGCGLITSAHPAAAPRAWLAVNEAGSAMLLPEGVPLVPQTMSRESADALVDLVGSTELPAGLDTLDGGEPDGVAALQDPSKSGVASGTAVDRGASSSDGESEIGVPAERGEDNGGEPAPVPVPRPGSADSEGCHESVMAGTAGQESCPPGAEDLVIDVRDGALEAAPGSASDGGAIAASRSSNVPRVLLLGEVRVDNAHGKAESTRIGRLAETAAFVLLHPGARPSELQSALWPGRRSNPQTCRQMISRTRTWLGRTPSGTPYLRPFAATEGRLQLSDQVTSDWADFQRLAHIGLSDPGDTTHLEAALALVRGRPFGSVAARELPWADLHINEMISAITDVAHALATRHEDAGRRHEAHDAALRGLLTECESEVLEVLASRTAP